MVCILQNQNKQEVTGPEPPLPSFPPSHVNWGKKKKKRKCIQIKKFSFKHWKLTKAKETRELVLAGKTPKGQHILGVEEKLGIKCTHTFGEKSGSIANGGVNVAGRWQVRNLEERKGFILGFVFWRRARGYWGT